MIEKYEKKPRLVLNVTKMNKITNGIKINKIKNEIIITTVDNNTTIKEIAEADEFSIVLNIGEKPVSIKYKK
ncbi:MAG: hypothetical protein LRY26_01275 [Bacilli bacterium]|nr:hypothetical protein [Bacilli bacterium]